jgi:hypothetical protein
MIDARKPRARINSSVGRLFASRPHEATGAWWRGCAMGPWFGWPAHGLQSDHNRAQTVELSERDGTRLHSPETRTRFSLRILFFLAGVVSFPGVLLRCPAVSASVAVRASGTGERIGASSRAVRLGKRRVQPRRLPSSLPKRKTQEKTDDRKKKRDK